MSAVRTAKIAAIQPALRLADVDHNLRRIEDLIRDAHREHAPDVIVVPEAATSPNVYHRTMRTVPRPVEGGAHSLFARLARQLDCAIGGGFLARRGGDVYGTYVLVEPDGSTHLHDKDQPTMWENNYYRGGRDDGLIHSAALDAPIGLTSGWELIRTRTAARLRGNVQLVLNGMCWPTSPLNWPGPAGWWGRREHDLQIRLARELPGQMARLVGAPVMMAAHVGPITMSMPLLPGVPYRTEMVGETQICERDGTTLASLTYADGEGHIAAEVGLGPPQPIDDLPKSFWIPQVTASVRATWDAANAHGSVKYRATKALGRHAQLRPRQGARTDGVQATP